MHAEGSHGNENRIPTRMKPNDGGVKKKLKKEGFLMIELKRRLYLKDGTNWKNGYFTIFKEQLKEFEEQIVILDTMPNHNP